MEAIVRALKDGQVSDEDVKRGKAILKASVLESYSTDKQLLGVLAKQAGILGKVSQADEVLKAIDAITADDVKAVSIVNICSCHVLVIKFYLYFRLPRK